MWTTRRHFSFLLAALLWFVRAKTISPYTTSDRFTRSHSPSVFLNQQRSPQEYFEVAYLPTPYNQPPASCSHQVILHSFGDTMNKPPFSTQYSPPYDCPPPWNKIVLELHVYCRGDQYDRIAGLWLGGVEILRTSTAEPTESGIFWTVRKDITRYYSLLVRSDLNLTMMLENIVNDVYTGVYQVNVTLWYYRSITDNRLVPVVQQRSKNSRSLLKKNRIEKNSGAAVDPLLLGPWDGNGSPADLIIPICDNSDSGFWFRVENEGQLHSKRIQIPKNTYRAVLELYVSFHGNDEFWYSNPPDSYLRMNNLTSGRGNGAYREVIVTIDDVTVGSDVPFPVIFTGGINPLFWEPFVAIGAFNLPSYDFELTSFLGLVMDGKEHTFSLGVEKSISFWYVNANLHLWLDHYSQQVHAHHVFTHFPDLKIKHTSDFIELDGSFEIEADREMKSVGWVQSSAGNITTIITQGFKFKNVITFDSNGNHKVTKQKHKVKKKIEVLNDQGKSLSFVNVKRTYPLSVTTLTKPGPKENRYTLVTNVTHALEEKYSGVYYPYSIKNKQDSNGWMEVEDHSVLSGAANTKQNYYYIDRLGCYTRLVAADNGKITMDSSSTDCSF